MRRPSRQTLWMNLCSSVRCSVLGVLDPAAGAAERKATKESPRHQWEHVEFGHLVGLRWVTNENGGSAQALHKHQDLGCRWNASAASVRAITGSGGPRGVCFVPQRLPASGGFVLGLTSAVADRAADLTGNQGMDSVDFAVHVVGGGIEAPFDVRESGAHCGSFGTLRVGDEVVVLLNSAGKVEYHVNGEVRHVSKQAPACPLHVKLCACATSTPVADIRWISTSEGNALPKLQLTTTEQQQRQFECLEDRLRQLTEHLQVLQKEHDAHPGLLMSRLEEVLRERIDQRLEVLETWLRNAEGAQLAERSALATRLASLEEQLAQTLVPPPAPTREANNQFQKDYACDELEQAAAQALSHVRVQINEAAASATQEHLSESREQLLKIHCSFVEEQLGGAEQRLEEFHRALAREHLEASDLRLHERHRSQEPWGMRRRAATATAALAQDNQEASGSKEPASSSANVPIVVDALAERSDSMHEQLEQLAAIQERMTRDASCRSSLIQVQKSDSSSATTTSPASSPKETCLEAAAAAK